MDVNRALIKGLYVEGVGRPFVLQRDNYTCYLCGKRRQGKHLTMDHVIPIDAGGPHCYDNVAAACEGCNRTKGNEILPVHHPKMMTALAAYERHHGHNFYRRNDLESS